MYFGSNACAIGNSGIVRSCLAWSPTVAQFINVGMTDRKMHGQTTIKTPNPKCGLSCYLIEVIDWRYSQSLMLVFSTLLVN